MLTHVQIAAGVPALFEQVQAARIKEDMAAKALGRLKAQRLMAEALYRQAIAASLEEQRRLPLEIRGDWRALADRYPEAVQALYDAADAVTNGGTRLWTEFIGLKAYDRWPCQRSDHTYGFGPKHGTTIASIGLSGEVLLRASRAREPHVVVKAPVLDAEERRLGLVQIAALFGTHE